MKSTKKNELKYAFVQKSANRKTGPMPLVSADDRTCWRGCPLRDCCYRLCGPLAVAQRRFEAGLRETLTFTEVLNRIIALPHGTVWRWGDVGDLPGVGAAINGRQALRLASSSVKAGLRGFCYTHKPVLSGTAGYGSTPLSNLGKIIEMNNIGFCVNLSVEGVAKLDIMRAEVGDSVPIVTVLPSTLKADWRSFTTPGGTRVLRCPAEYRGVQCASRCGGARGPLCAQRNRKVVIGLTAHGWSKRVNAAIEREEKRWGPVNSR